MFTPQQLKILKLKLFVLKILSPFVFILAIVLTIILIPFAALALLHESNEDDPPTYPFYR